jgi:catechol 2,3-dioxygenase-like lactoylglutathione lyase family enzyme
MKRAAQILTAPLLCSALLCATANTGSAQAARVGPVGTFTGVGNILHMISDLKRAMAFYNTTLGFKIQRMPRGPAEDPYAYIKLLPIIGPMYLMADDAEYRSAEVFLSGPAVRLEMEDFKGQASKAVHPRLVDPGATVMMLWVKDVDAILKSVTSAGGEIVSAGKKPVAMKGNGGSQKVLFVRDPDGFLIEFIQPDVLPAEAAAAGQNAFNTGLGISVNDLDATATFYREKFGFDVKETAEFVNDPPFLNASGLKGVKIRRASTTVPGTSFPIEFMEFTGERKAIFPEIHDPGATMFRVTINDLPGVVKNLRGAGVKINSTTGEPTNNQLVVQATDGVFFQLTNAREPGAPGAPAARP